MIIIRSFARKVAKNPLNFPQTLGEKPELARLIDEFIDQKLQKGDDPADMIKYMFGEEAFKRVAKAVKAGDKNANFDDVEFKVPDELMEKLSPFMPTEHEISEFKRAMDEAEKSPEIKENEDNKDAKPVMKREPKQSTQELEVEALNDIEKRLKQLRSKKF